MPKQVIEPLNFKPYLGYRFESMCWGSPQLNEVIAIFEDPSGKTKPSYLCQVVGAYGSSDYTADQIRELDKAVHEFYHELAVGMLQFGPALMKAVKENE